MHRERSAENVGAVGGWALAVASIFGSAWAQAPSEVQTLPKIEVVGSNIPGPVTETALPVQILTRDDILRSGATTTAELLNTVSANVLGFNDQLAVSSTQPGLSSANLRGIGDGSTLVLLNGRRVANYAFNGGAVDLNTIPLSAIERVEVLKDGASAIYGTDAIAGVINFVLRKDFEGAEVTGYGAWGEHGGAGEQQATVSVGYGDLLVDRVNVFATVSYQNQPALHATDRPFSRTGYIPGEGIALLSAASFPASIRVAPGILVNPTYATGCAPPTMIPVNLPFLSREPLCGYDFTSAIDLTPSAERTGVLGRASFALTADSQLFAEASLTENRFVFRNSPTAVFEAPGNSSSPVLYPIGGPYYPTAFAAANGLSGDLNVRYRTVPLGPQTDVVNTQALRFVVGAEGTRSGWSYGAAVSYSENRQSDSFASGYVSQQRLIPALATGLINPFGASGPDGSTLLASTQIVGDMHDGKGTTWSIDAKGSRAVYELPGGSLEIALGGEARQERLDNRYAAAFVSGDVLGVGGDQQSVGSGRNVEALFIEARLPLLKGFEAQLAARYDHYSDFGGTTNPKVALRWQPVPSLVLRTSWGTGFRAPTLYDLFTPLSYGGVFGTFNDPVRCPVTGLPSDCPGLYGGAFRAAVGGNPNLRPERSEQFNAGIVWEPVGGVSVTGDYWKIDKSGVIGTLDAPTVFSQFDRYGQTNIIRGPVDTNYPNLPGPIETVLLTNQNLGDLRTSGVDVDINWSSRTTPIGKFAFNLDGTYVLSWEEQLDGINFISMLGSKGSGAIPGPVPRWKHSATLNWEFGSWGATVAQTYQSGYTDANVDRNGEALSVPPRRVGSYDIWDVQGRYTGFQHAVVALGVKNLMDRAPPFSNQPYTRQVGYDPAYADPLGRVFYARLTLTFN